MKIYLDACCLNRPFDDQTQDRIRLEAEAVLLILNRLGRGEWEWIGSNVLDAEIGRTPDMDRRERVKILAGFAHYRVDLGESDFDRIAQLERLGLIGFDAYHIACAEIAGCQIFLTTDDHLLSVVARNIEKIHVQVLNPLTWLEKVLME